MTTIIEAIQERQQRWTLMALAIEGQLDPKDAFDTDDHFVEIARMADRLSIDNSLLLTVAKAVIEWVSAEYAWMDADMAYGPRDLSPVRQKEIREIYECATERSKAASNALIAFAASLKEEIK